MSTTFGAMKAQAPGSTRRSKPKKAAVMPPAAPQKASNVLGRGYTDMGSAKKAPAKKRGY